MPLRVQFLVGIPALCDGLIKSCTPLSLEEYQSDVIFKRKRQCESPVRTPADFAGDFLQNQGQNMQAVMNLSAPSVSLPLSSQSRREVRWPF